MKRSISTVATLIATAGLMSGCFIEVKWKPPVLPISFAINSNGEIEVSAETAVVTPIGQFGIEGGVSHEFPAEDGKMAVVIRHVKNGSMIQQYLGKIMDPPGDRIVSYVGPRPTSYFYNEEKTEKATAQDAYLVTFDRPAPNRQIVGRNGGRFTWVTPCGEFAKTD